MCGEAHQTGVMEKPPPFERAAARKIPLAKPWSRILWVPSWVTFSGPSITAGTRIARMLPVRSTSHGAESPPRFQPFVTYIEGLRKD
jgi:hypothetical protein